jgi:glycine/D-amino acid oxidase-like deaminating enzyme
VRVVICGAGVIGASLAYFLTRRGIRPTVVERTGVACAASGKSGGFLAWDWCDRTPLAHLARRSFALHAGLSEELGADWGYRRVTTYAGATARGVRAPASRFQLHWLSGDISIHDRLGSPQTTAQVQPAQYTAAMMRAAQANGAELRIGSVTNLCAQDATTHGVEVDGEFVPADVVAIAMGPWSALPSRWLGLPDVYGLKGHSLVFETGSRIPAEALFLEYQDESGATYSPEVFPRSDGTTYVCAISSESPLPVDPSDVAPDSGAIERLEMICAKLSPILADSKIIARQACYRPVTENGLPVIGAVPGLKGAFVATGHSVWGILNAPATGEALAELIVEGSTRQIDLSPFSPRRLPG